MTHLCYTIEEAAGKLGLSETVLVRLSQYFKVPKVAYEDVGYLSFKGDLVFSDQDIAFFRQVKERLLAGETLDEVKSRIRPDEAIPVAARSESSPAFSELIAGAEQPIQMTQPVRAPAIAHASNVVPIRKEVPSPPMEEIREIEDRTPYEKAAEQSFARYKSQHRAGLGRVFENMLKEVGSMAKKRPTLPSLKPLKGKVREPENFNMDEFIFDPKAVRQDAILPFKALRQAEMEFDDDAEVDMTWASPVKEPGRMSLPKPSGLWPRGSVQDDEASWERIIRQATSQPRTLDSHLKNAAILLRDRALGQSTPESHSS